MAQLVSISLLSFAVVLVIVGVLFPGIEDSTSTMVYQVCPLH